MTFLAQILQQLGYIGATGATPYRACSASQIATYEQQDALHSIAPCADNTPVAWAFGVISCHQTFLLCAA